MGERPIYISRVMLQGRIVLAHSDGVCRKRNSEYFDPCQEAADRSLRCLRRNGGDRAMCQDYFEYAIHVTRVHVPDARTVSLTPLRRAYSCGPYWAPPYRHRVRRPQAAPTCSKSAKLDFWFSRAVARPGV